MKLSLIFGILSMLILIGNGIFHEEVHKSIYKTWGINSTVDYIDGFDMTIHPDSPCPTENCRLANSINEAVSYNFNGFYLMLVFGIFFILLVLEERKEMISK